MSCGLLITTTTTTTTTSSFLPKQPLNPRSPHPTFSSRAKKWPSLYCSCPSKFKASRASVEEGGLFIEEIKTYKSFYELLGISQEGSFDEIKRAYKQMARKYHPDVSPPERAEEYTQRFIEVHEAYETLSDLGRRAIYDRDLARGFHLAFSSRRRFDEERDQRTEWKNRWQYQVEELKKKSTYNDSAENLSWGARMRRQRAESS